MSSQEIMKMKELNTITDLIEYVQKDLSPRVDRGNAWSIVGAIGAILSGLAAFGGFLLVIFK